MMKKVFALILAAIMVCSMFAGCGSSAADDTDYSKMTIEELKPLIKTIADGKITVATSPDFAPYEFYALDDAGKPTLVGFDMALAGYIGEFIGLEVEIVPMDFDGTIMEVAGKKADLGMAGYSPDPEREKVMDFSLVYYTGGQSFVTSKANADKFPDLASANKEGYQIGAQIGSIQQKLAEQNTPDADIIPLAKVTDIIAEVLNGKLDGAFIEKLPAESYAKNYPELVVALDVPYDAEGSVIGVSKGNGPLLAAVNLALQAAMDDGSLAQFVADATALAEGNTYEGLLDNGAVPTEAAEG